MATPVTLELTLDLDRYLIRSHYLDDNGEEHGEPSTLETLVLDEAARQVVASLPREIRAGLTQRVTEIRNDLIRDLARPIIMEALSTPLQRTNTYGEKIAGETTIREIIVTETQAWLTGRQRSGSTTTVTNVQALIREEVAAALKKELTAEIDAAKAEVRAAVKDQAAALLAGTIVAMAEQQV